jgi:hypothetical protein
MLMATTTVVPAELFLGGAASVLAFRVAWLAPKTLAGDSEIATLVDTPESSHRDACEATSRHARASLCIGLMAIVPAKNGGATPSIHIEHSASLEKE